MVKTAVVVDCACLIGLERSGHLDVLSAMFDLIFAPPAVCAEFGAVPAWISLERPADAGMVAALRLLVDPGESEAIVLAYEKGLRIILDDPQGAGSGRPSRSSYHGHGGFAAEGQAGGGDRCGMAIA